MISSRRRLRLAGCLAALSLVPGMVAAQTSESPVAPARQQLTILMEHRSAPFSFIDPEGKPAGFAVDLTRAVAEDQGFEVKFDQRPWQAVYNDFLQGRGDILGLVGFSEERARLMDFSIAYELMHCRLYVHENSEPIRTTTDLAGKRIAVIRNAITHEYVERHPEWRVTLVPCDTLTECLAAVQSGRADVALGMQFVTDYIIRTQGIIGIESTELELRDMNYRLCFAVHRGETRLLARLNDGLTNVRANGTYDRIYEKWLGPLQPRKLRWRDFQPYVLPALALLGVALVAFGWQRRMLARISKHSAALHESEERLSLVLEASQDGFWDWDVAKGEILRSPRWYAMLGYTPDDIENSREGFVGLLHPDDLERVLTNEREIQKGRDHFSLEFRIRTKSGEWKWALDRGKVVLRDPVTRKPLRITGTQTDITARKISEQESETLQRKMQETQRLESLGVLAGGVAHDFNNLLTVIIGNASLLRLDHHCDANTTAQLDKIASAANRAADLCRQLLAYAGKGALTIERLQLNDVIRDTAHMVELSPSRRASVDYVLSPNLPAIEADPAHLQQVIVNLLMNANDAMGDSTGHIRVETKVRQLVRGELIDALPSSDLPAGSYVKLEISDTGCGMPPEVTRQIFDPFYTTKSTGRGLGLPAVLGIVRSLNGALTVRSKPGHGTVVRIYFPHVPVPPTVL